MKILAFAGSNNPQSINQQLAAYATGLLSEHGSTLINLRDYPMPLFSVEILGKEGVPENSILLFDEIQKYDAFIISIAENNRSVTAVFKNTIDWLSKSVKTNNPADTNVFRDKPVLLLSTSPGSVGASVALENATGTITQLGGNVVDKFSLPIFYQNTKIDADGFHIVNESMSAEFKSLIVRFENKLSERATINH
ncbi:MAG: NAD(P)H-dependent oxidoreductase [Bacteroidetes bacterium]|nr:NAD(P)H-dependent oxidoreductase [Bacteroidota bacterium]